MTERAVRAARAANSPTATAPCTGPGRLQTTAAATTAPPTSTATTSTIVVRVSSLPPAAPKATPAKAAPRITSAARGAWERSTRGRDLGQERHSAEQWDATAQRDEHAGHREQAEGDQRHQQRCGQVVARAGQVEQAVGVGLDGLVTDLHTGRARAAVGVTGDRSQRLGVLAALGLLLGRQWLPVRARVAGTPAALVGPALDGSGEDLAAVAVLVAVRGQAVERLLEL